MAVGTLDSIVFGPLFSDSEIAALFSDQSYIGRLVEVEIALARTEAKLGIIPSAAADAIGRVRAAHIRPAVLTAGTIRSGFPVIPLIQEIRKQAGTEAAAYVHWGATTQDVMDTASVLQFREAIRIFRARLGELAGHLSQLADGHRGTLMAGRTHSQQALPVTFGLKAAGWLLPLVRSRRRLEEISARLLVVQFGGAAGTLAALGARGLQLVEAFSRELELNTPTTPWHAQRDTFAEFAGWLSLVTGSLGKMAQDVILLAQTEVGEVAETKEAGRGGSSTMPQKANPVTSELILSAARMNATLLAAVHNAQIQEHERGTHGWQVEWLSLPQMVALTGGALKNAIDLAVNLQVDEARMRDNIAAGHDLILGEAAVFALAGIMPRPDAEACVREAVSVASAERRPFVAALREVIKGKFGREPLDLEAALTPENYLGANGELIDRALGEAKRSFS